MRRLLWLAAFAATPIYADTLDCLMQDGQRITFVIDRNQFIDAVTAEEPIRRKVTIVQDGDKTYPAEPFIIGNTRGFHASGLGDASLMFVVSPTGEATFANAQTGEKRSGTCADITQ